MLSMSKEVYLGRNPPGHQDVLGLTKKQLCRGLRDPGIFAFCLLNVFVPLIHVWLKIHECKVQKMSEILVRISC